MQSYTRRQLKKDKFAETTQGAFQWASGHRQGTTTFLIIVVALAAIGTGLYFWYEHRSEQANFALSKAMRTISAPVLPAGTPPSSDLLSFASTAERSKQAQKEFADIASNYSFTRPAAFARYMAGVAAYQAGDNAAAEQQLRTASESWDRDVAALAKLALATLYRSTNRQAEAAKLYGELRDHASSTVSKTEVLFELAAMYEPTDPKQAQSIYEQIKKDSPPDSPAVQAATSKLAALKK